jgi:cytochrome c oxidase subunit 4
MSETHLTHDQEMDVESHAPYGKVWVTLLVFTLIEYFWAHIFKDTFATLVLGLMFWATIKAGLVGWFFMHLKFEGNWVYVMLIPAGILAAVLIFGLVPDIASQKINDEGGGEEEAAAVLIAPREADPLPLPAWSPGSHASVPVSVPA